jgi:dihydrodipicolinate synthase/N-acetylneuraminate lyase
MKPLSTEIKKRLLHGTVIPAHPLALNANRELDEERQRLLTRYYLAAGAGGLAVGVHTTQFEIHDPETGLYPKVLALAAEEIERTKLSRPVIKIAGVSGPTEQAVEEAQLAAGLGYDLALASMNGLGHWTEKALLERIEKIGEEIPLFGFYLQPAVGGRVLSIDFWRQFAEMPNTHAIKMAPFNRYQTLDVVRAVCLSSRADEIALYTGNDDNILLDLLTTYEVQTPRGLIRKDIVGGLLGHWAVWTAKAVELLERVQALKTQGGTIGPEWLSENIRITDANAAFFDAQNSFRGCIAGIHEVLRRQGLLAGTWCLNPEEKLSPGQSGEIDRVYREYPDLNDDRFVQGFLNNS